MCYDLVNGYQVKYNDGQDNMPMDLQVPSVEDVHEHDTMDPLAAYDLFVSSTSNVDGVNHCSWSSTSSPSPSPAIVAHQICDGEIFISADDLRINLWNLEISNQSFNIVDVKPANMEDLTEMENLITSICWQLVKEGYIAIWRKALNNS
ncbi:hypothetical protein LWI28_027003 [Acer negundo]|uniref:Uncharacterized protein n=1 Tax=Acer negundo TaxID=4023 RepID=A0AAD5JH56_ACENE|nr:hypothetical protein LWI28_027003 [Acer negundo]